MTVPQIPFALPSLTFFSVFDADRLGEFSWRAKLEMLDTGKQLGQAMGMWPVREPGKAVNVLGFRNLLIDQVGTLTLSLSIDGERDPFLSSIDVILAPQSLTPQRHT